jgi:hypothetical protein
MERVGDELRLARLSGGTGAVAIAKLRIQLAEAHATKFGALAEQKLLKRCLRRALVPYHLPLGGWLWLATRKPETRDRLDRRRA